MRTRTFKGIPTSLQARQKFEFSLFPVPPIWKREKRSCAIGPKKKKIRSPPIGRRRRRDVECLSARVNQVEGGGTRKDFFAWEIEVWTEKKRAREKEMMGWIRIFPINKPCWSRFWFINRVRFLCSIPSGREIRSLWFFPGDKKATSWSNKQVSPKSEGGKF